MTDVSRFAGLGLASDITRAVAEEGYSEPTPIQQRAIPEILQGHDLLAAAQTGTGKTAAFTLPLLQRLLTDGQRAGRKQVRVLVLVPTRELAAQVQESVRTYGRHVAGIRTVLIFGGVGINPQIEQLAAGAEIVVATPGRLLDHVGQKTVDLSKIDVLVLDEADRMLDMGFIHDIRRVIKLLPAQRQNLLFSATFSPDIRKLAEGLLERPVTIDIAPRNSAAETVDQRVLFVDKSRKTDLLIHLAKGYDWKQTLVFTRTKHGANRLVEKLIKAGITAAALHGNKSQSARTKALAGFKANEIRILVATDIAARGIDIDQLPHVVNFELPNVAEDYVHRIGRTGRAGNVGEAFSLVSSDERSELRGIEKLLGRSLPSFEVDGFEAGSAPAAEPTAEAAQGQGERPSAGPRAAGEPGDRNGRRRRRGRGRGPGGDAQPRQDAGGNARPPRPSQPQPPRGERESSGRERDEFGDINGNLISHKPTPPPREGRRPFRGNGGRRGGGGGRPGGGNAYR
ncbi:DEAD/DEAH box helicase [Solimonas marina]|uniref:DEAD-box ATP-dependent RNA helicase RhpA n=1 Tax=Solimonas marina TaxID=2714601 RepID=A0A970B639_9GAMM|nr:DEAD/DEAH box helicase [Solimonas marina]NKF24052.1 DEAD/DEAH box helicase [Solimonas marina]